MSSSCEENAEHLKEVSVECNMTEEISETPIKDEKSEVGHVKPKRRRRGKKRKHRKESVSASACENGAESPTWDSDEDLSCGLESYNNVVLRPINVPKAPENSTQFIMDDHDECRLYFSFENPKPSLFPMSHQDGEDFAVTEPVGEDAAYQDIDYEYESPQDFDNSAYYDREFELSYNNNRYEELLVLSRPELIAAIERSEFRLKELEDDITKQNPTPVLEELQTELLHLQEENIELKECNSKLDILALKNETDDSISEHSPADVKISGGQERISTTSLTSTESDSCNELNDSVEVDCPDHCDSIDIEFSEPSCFVTNDDKINNDKVIADIELSKVSDGNVNKDCVDEQMLVRA